jgi:HK97 gp10 family phage protein
MGFDASEVMHLAADLAAAPAKVGAKSVHAVETSAQQTQRNAQRFAPVLTGRLREGIRVEASGLSAEVVSTVRYADYVEYGTSDTAPQPYMRPAADLLPGLSPMTWATRGRTSSDGHLQHPARRDLGTAPDRGGHRRLRRGDARDAED